MNHETIAKCNSDELKAFITARNQDLPISKLPNKGNISKAIQGESNLISLTYKYRSLPSRIRKQVLEEVKEVEEEEDNKLVDWDDRNQRNVSKNIFTIVNIDSTQDGLASSQLTSSSLLGDCEWVNNVRKCFIERNNVVEGFNIRKDQIEQSKNFYKILKGRLTYHICNRIEDTKKNDHWHL